MIDLRRYIPFASPSPADTPVALERFLARVGKPLQTSGVGDLLEGAMRFYAEQPVRGLARDDGDMLLFQHGCYDWGEGEHFQLDLTRQFTASNRGRTISQLRLTLLFPPEPELRRLRADELWCASREQVGAFRSAVLDMPATKAVRARSPLVRRVVWGRV